MMACRRKCLKSNPCWKPLTTCLAKVHLFQRCISTHTVLLQQFREEWLRFLVCPVSKQPLRYDSKKNELVNDSLFIRYPIRDGIPLLTPWDGNKETEQISIETSQRKV
ncbi:hypothetical protein GpartN1_g7695.t1 [Galdieria partita]|uniref:Protein preY, mitochondrial n=1 Tax=Galdieria partita TaxID=83374 RepID=A0A9C7Q5D1_9RHOD|nr:hypothetical protein GpartN1_g7695.t1 [Galdieria partita]